jgi:hypothetical protein
LAFKVADTTEEIEQRKSMLVSHAVVITEEGPMGIQTREEVKDILLHHFGIRKHECYIYRSSLEPFVAIFLDAHDRYVVFVVEKVEDGPVVLAFRAWDLDRFGDRKILSYLVRLSIEGIPQHAWVQEVANKVLCDEALIHLVEEETLNRSDQRVYRCWAFSKYPSRIPQIVFLTLTDPEQDNSITTHSQSIRPRGVKHCHVFQGSYPYRCYRRSFLPLSQR